MKAIDEMKMSKIQIIDPRKPWNKCYDFDSNYRRMKDLIDRVHYIQYHRMNGLIDKVNTLTKETCFSP